MDHEIWQFGTENQHPHLLIFGAIHGNEPCGPMAIRRLKQEIETGQVALIKGTLTLIPVCNPEAFRLQQRSVEENLNRIFHPLDTPLTYEQKLAQALIPFVDRADMLLDIHSYRGPTMPFVMCDHATGVNLKWARSLALPMLITGWNELYPEGGDTNSHAHAMGKHALTIECGQHQDSQAPEIAYQSILRSLAFFGMIASGKLPIPADGSAKHGHMNALYRYQAGWQWSRPWQHADTFTAHQVLARNAEGETITEDFDGIILMPKPDVPSGEEWFYTARLQRDDSRPIG